jgi:TRAP-type C4-dicarboxylate transport system substrate-binding protein
MKRNFCVMASLFFVIVFIGFMRPVCAAEKVIELKMAELYPVTHTLHKEIFVPWAADLEKRTNGRMKVMFYPSEALGKAKDHYDLVDRGIADLSDVPMVYMPGRFPLSSVLDLPLGIPSSKVGTRVGWELYDKYLRPEFPGVKIISYETNDPGHLFTTKKPVKTLADVKGMRLRVAGTWVTRTVKELGGSAVAMPAPDAYDALQKGMVEGLLIPDSGIIDFKLEDLIKYQTAEDLYVVPSVCVMNLNTYNSLPPDLKKIFDEMTGPSLRDRISTAFDAHGQEAREVMKKRGVEVIKLSPDQKKAWEIGRAHV